MPHDPVRVAETRAWLAKAASDPRAGAHELAAQPPLAAHACFDAQQAVEKAVKAYLVWREVPFRKTHDLAVLGAACEELDRSLGPLLLRAARITQYAWRYRYPGEPEEPPREEAQAALALAREVYEAILARLPEEVRP